MPLSTFRRSEASPERNPRGRCLSHAERESSLLTTTGLNPLDHRDDFSGPALRHEGLNSFFQVALYLPSSDPAHS